MENKFLQAIAKATAQALNSRYGFCGVAMGDDFTQLNSTDQDGNDILIKFEVKKPDHDVRS